MTGFAGQLPRKFVDLLTELVPGASTIGLLVHPDNPVGVEIINRNIEGAARAKGLELSVQKARNDGKIDAAFDAFAQAKPNALIIMLMCSFSARFGNSWRWRCTTSTGRGLISYRHSFTSERS